MTESSGGERLFVDIRRFFAERLKPDIDSINASRKKALLFSMLIGVVIFGCMFFVVRHFVKPYAEVFAGDGSPVWPLYILLPLTMAVLAFSIFYIIALKAVVGDFNCIIMTRLAEFIDPGVLYDKERKIAADQVDRSLLFGDGPRPEIGGDVFRGGLANGVRFEFAEIVRPRGAAATAGVFFAAAVPESGGDFMLLLPPEEQVGLSWLGDRAAEYGIAVKGGLVRLTNPDTGWQVVLSADEPEKMGDIALPALTKPMEEARRACGVDLYLAKYGGKMYLATANPREDVKRAGYFGSFDLDRCQEFCRDSRMCLEVLRGIIDGGG